MHCASFTFSVALWIGKSEMAVLAKIGSGGTSGFNLDLHCIRQFGSEVMMCPAAQLAMEARMLICTWLTCFQQAVIGFIFHAHIASEQGSRC